MKIFVTVGTTPFDALVEELDRVLDPAAHDALFQIAAGKSRPERFPYREYVDDPEARYRSADLVVTHAGAGTIFRLLELNKRFIIVPNLVRSDRHQTDIARYMERHGHAVVCWDLAQLKGKVLEAERFSPTPFQKNASNAHLLIESFLRHHRGDL